MEQISIKIDNFEGPLDLLMHLIEKNKMEVSVHVRLRHYRYAITGCLQYSTQDRRAKRRMVYIRVAGEEDDVHFIPAAQIRLFAGCRQVF